MGLVKHGVLLANVILFSDFTLLILIKTDFI